MIGLVARLGQEVAVFLLQVNLVKRTEAIEPFDQVWHKRGGPTGNGREVFDGDGERHEARPQRPTQSAGRYNLCSFFLLFRPPSAL